MLSRSPSGRHAARTPATRRAHPRTSCVRRCEGNERDTQDGAYRHERRALAQALDLAERFPAHRVGVTVDTYHIWWDDRAPEQIARAGAGGRIHTFQLADWTTPLPEGVLDGRGQIGDGAIGMREWKGHVEAAGHTGPIEVELFDEALWARDGREVLAETATRFVRHAIRSAPPS